MRTINNDNNCQQHQQSEKAVGSSGWKRFSDNCQQRLPTINNDCQQQMQTINNKNKFQQRQQSEKAVGGSGRKRFSNDCQQQLPTTAANNSCQQQQQQQQRQQQLPTTTRVGGSRHFTQDTRGSVDSWSHVTMGQRKRVCYCLITVYCSCAAASEAEGV